MAQRNERDARRYGMKKATNPKGRSQQLMDELRRQRAEATAAADDATAQLAALCAAQPDATVLSMSKFIGNSA